ncbi:MAG: right-handed parallel beta-helix repeat-containing protein [Limnochordia bacterium]
MTYRFHDLALVIVTCILVLTLDHAVCGAENGNLLMYPGFEDVAEGDPVGWGRYAPLGSPKGLQVSTAARSGRFAALIDVAAALEGSGAKAARVAWYHQRLVGDADGRAVRGAQYRFFAYYRTEGDLLGKLAVERRTLAGKADNLYLDLPPSQEWRQASLMFTWPEAGDYGVHVGLYAWLAQEGKIWFDDVELVRVDSEDAVERPDRDPSTFYVSPDGNDQQAGSLEAPWATLTHAAAQAIPGDTVLLLPGVYHGTLRPTRSGTAAAPITFRALERRTAQLVGEYGSAYALQLSHVEHIHIEGLHIKPMSTQGRWLLVDGSKHIRITDALMEDASGSMPFLINNSEQVQVRDSVIRRYVGHNMARVSHSKWVLFEGNAISRTGHSPLQFYPVGSNQYVVVRDNVFHPAWGRAFEFFATQDLLFEGNIVTNSYDGGRSASSNAKILSRRGIFRFNRVFRNWGGPISASPGTEWQFRGIRLYHNVFDGNLEYGLSGSVSAANVGDVKYVNNVFSRNDVHGNHCQVQFTGTGSPEANPQGELEPRIRFLNNVVIAQDPSIEATIGFGSHSLAVDTVESDSWGQLSMSNRAVHFAGNLAVDPRFVDETQYNHALATDSPLLDSGRFLTSAVGTGEGRVLPVEDAGFFYDGFGIEGEVGDLIAIGRAEKTARVVKVDRTRNELTLDRSVRWDDGAPVSLPWGGDGPDIGVYEYGPHGRPSVQIMTDPFIAEPGEEVRLHVVLLGIDDPVEIRWQLGDGTMAVGAELRHRYAESYDYPIRVRVTTASGDIHRGTGYVVVEAPRAIDDPLLHSTFDADDADWWWNWKSYRPTPTDWERELDPVSRNGALRISNPGGGTLPVKLAPAEWDIDRYPWIYLRYRVLPGTPIGIYLDAFRSMSGAGQRMWVAATASQRSTRSGQSMPYELIDDGEWHTLLMDARLMREQFPDVQVLQRLGIEALSASKQGDTYWLDEAAILPAEAGNTVEWQQKLAQMQRGHIDIVSPAAGRGISGDMVVDLVVAQYPAVSDEPSWAIERLEVAIDGQPVLVTRDLEEVLDLHVDTLSLPDGKHSISVEVVDDEGATTRRDVAFTVRNWEVMRDELKPPEQITLFGTTITYDNSMTEAESDGWAYAADLEAPAFQGVTGKVKTSDREEYLMWQAPGLRSFEVVVYSKETQIDAIVKMMAAVGVSEWVSLPFDVEAMGTTEDGWTKFVLTGQGPQGMDATAFRLDIGSLAAAHAFRMEEVSLGIRTY